jgi:hypothetical protein
MSNTPIVFTATGSIQTHVVPVTGRYIIEAAGAQGGAGGGPGGKGARLRGTFFLHARDLVQIVVGLQGTAGTTPLQSGGGGGTFVWKGASDRLHPDEVGGSSSGLFVWSSDSTNPFFPSQPMLAAGGGGGGNGSDAVITTEALRGAASGGRNGHGGAADWGDFHYSGGGGAGWRSSGAQGSAPTFCAGGGQWAGGAGANYNGHQGGSGGFGGGGGGSFIGCGSGGGGGYSGGGGGTQWGPGGGGGGSYNAGADQLNLPGVQTGDGYVTILALASMGVPERLGQATSAGEPLPGSTKSHAVAYPIGLGHLIPSVRRPTPAGEFHSVQLWRAACASLRRSYQS